MKLTKFLILFLVFFNSNLFAQDSVKLKSSIIIKTDILLPVLGLATNYKIGSLTIELCLMNRHSLQFTGFVSNYSSSYRTNKSKQLIPSYKYYLSKSKIQHGLYSGIYLKGSQLIQIYDHRKDTYNPTYLEFRTKSISGGPIIGYQKYFRERIVFDILLGIGARKKIHEEIIKSGDIGFGLIKESNVDGILALNIGYKF